MATYRGSDDSTMRTAEHRSNMNWIWPVLAVVVVGLLALALFSGLFSNSNNQGTGNGNTPGITNQSGGAGNTSSSGTGGLGNSGTNGGTGSGTTGSGTGSTG